MRRHERARAGGYRSEHKAPGLPWLAALDSAGVLHVRADSDYPADYEQQNPVPDVYGSRLPDVRQPLEDMSAARLKETEEKESTGYRPAVQKEETLEQHLARYQPEADYKKRFYRRR
jgi:hypothetical protein